MVYRELINRAKVKQKYIDVLVEKKALPIYQGRSFIKDEIPNMLGFIEGITLYHESPDGKKYRSLSNKALSLEAKYNYQNVSKIRIDLGLIKNGIGREISGANDPISIIWEKLNHYGLKVHRLF